MSARIMTSDEVSAVQVQAEWSVTEAHLVELRPNVAKLVESHEMMRAKLAAARAALREAMTWMGSHTPEAPRRGSAPVLSEGALDDRRRALHHGWSVLGEST